MTEGGNGGSRRSKPDLEPMEIALHRTRGSGTDTAETSPSDHSRGTVAERSADLESVSLTRVPESAVSPEPSHSRVEQSLHVQVSDSDRVHIGPVIHHNYFHREGIDESGRAMPSATKGGDSPLTADRPFGVGGDTNAGTPAIRYIWNRDKLGSGSYGQVFLGWDTHMNRRVAVKVVGLGSLSKQLSKEAKALDHEIRLLRDLTHDAVIQYFGCYQDDVVFCIFMEYMAGGSVYDELVKSGPLKESVARVYIRKVLDGLRYLHDNKVTHRDVKGANILKDAIANIKLCDFGVSKRLHTINSHTAGQSFKGTVYWMSPEVVKGETCNKADIWSLGCTVVEMLTCDPPWKDFEPMAAVFKIGNMVNPIFELPSNTSEEAKDFLNQTFTMDPGERPTAEQMLGHAFVTQMIT